MEKARTKKECVVLNDGSYAQPRDSCETQSMRTDPSGLGCASLLDGERPVAWQSRSWPVWARVQKTAPCISRRAVEDDGVTVLARLERASAF